MDTLPLPASLQVPTFAIRRTNICQCLFLLLLLNVHVNAAALKLLTSCNFATVRSLIPVLHPLSAS